MPRLLTIICIVAWAWVLTGGGTSNEPFASAAGAQPQSVAVAATAGDAKAILGMLRLQQETHDHTEDLSNLDELLAAVQPNDPDATALYEWLCWRHLPVVSFRREAFAKDLAQLKQHVAASGKASDWLAVFQMYDAYLQRDRASLCALAGSPLAGTTAPTRWPATFPSRSADAAAFDALVASGVPQLEAGLRIIGSRQFDALHGLSDLDRHLSRESRYLLVNVMVNEGRAVAAARDHLREAYVNGSKHLVERLFALNLAEKSKQRDELLEETRLVRDRFEKLGGVREAARRMDEKQRWSQLVEPMLESDLSLLTQGQKLLDAISADPRTSVRIEAGRSERKDGAMHYAGGVRIVLGDATLSCDQAIVKVGRDPQDRVMMTVDGDGQVVVTGRWGTARADRVSFVSLPATFDLSGNVQVESSDGTSKLTAATLTLNGAITRQSSLLDEFRNAPDLDAKLALVPRLGEVFDNDELEGEARFLLGLKLLEPHLSWHAPHATPSLKDKVKELQSLEELREDDGYRSRWARAMGPAPWMKLPEETLAQAKAALDAAQKNAPEHDKDRLVLQETHLRELCYWRIKDPNHADVVRALRLLEGVGDKQLRHAARQWATEIRRNNTVLTFDTPGGFGTGLEAPLVMDVRNADRVDFKLYRVSESSQLQSVAERIGEDFIFRDYGLQQGLDPLKAIPRMREEVIRQRVQVLSKRMRMPLPQFTEKDLVQQWHANVAELQWLGLTKNDHSHWNEFDDWNDYGDDDWYFGDANEQFNDRLRKEYRPHRHDVSSWRTDRLVSIPARALNEPGGYVLVASANGQSAHVPIIVEPLSVTLRRARDGVFVMASDATGRFPVIGAKVSAPEAMGDETTDRRGVAFLRVHAAGDRPIIVHKDGRYAIAGFGRVFDGLYKPWWDDDQRIHHRAMKDRLRQIESDTIAQVYDDRFVIAAYTDRPTYRPGQRVNFKLIVRELPIAANQGGNGTGFRAGAFDLAERLVTPKAGKETRWEIINPRGRAIASGQGALSDFGTSAGDTLLTDEAALGRYALRVTIDDMAHIVPDVFAVKSYRRPNFELQMEGVPETLVATEAEAITLKITGRYYFGLPVAGGNVNVRLVRPDQFEPLAEADVTLNPEGSATVEMMLPQKLPSGVYAVIGTLTDDSGRSVSVTHAMELRGRAEVAGTTNLPALPRFVSLGDDLVIRSPRDAINVTLGDGNEAQVFPTKDGSATIRLGRAGWHRIQSGEEAVEVFVYGGEGSPFASLPPDRVRGGHDDDAAEEAGWVNLTDFAVQEGTGHDRRDDRDHHLYALFERHHAIVGDKLRVLIYCPVNQPRILLTIEGRSVIDYLDISLAAKAGRYQVVEIPIKAHYGPNFYLQGRILASLENDAPKDAARVKLGDRKARELEIEADDRGLDPRWCRVDVIDPNRKPTGQKLNVSITTESSTYKPGDEVNARIVVTDLQGKPVETELSLSAVDESVFSFGEDSLDSLANVLGQPVVARQYEPKAWRSTIGSRWSRATLSNEAMAMASAEKIQRLQESMKSISRTLAMQREAVQDVAAQERAERPTPLPFIEGKLPVTTLPMPALRSDFRETAAWLPQLRTDGNGVAIASFRLPDSLTRYRLSAVGLTRGTDVGVGRSQLSATLPLSVQVMLPRFAIEKDELRAVALVHNTTDKARTCSVRWAITGAKVRAGDDEAYTRSERDGAIELQREVTVPARSSARVTAWLTCDQVGSINVTCHVADRDQADMKDAEARLLGVTPLGRPRELVFGGTFRGQQRIDLPDGFVPQDIRVTASPNDLPHALQGLGYLVEYPYGCVEQTMSRFMPLVMVKHAAQKTAIDLPPDAMATLPEALKRGLARLYNFQHEDGSWGWFRKDDPDDAMSLYVAYGLVRCRLTGTPIEQSVIDRACAFLQRRVRVSELPEHHAARARYILALAGKAEKADVFIFAQELLAREGDKLPPGAVLVNAALACRETGLSELGARLWSRARAWKPVSTSEQSLMLMAQVAFGESIEACDETIGAILGQRKGTRWNHTRDTAWALEALSEFVAYAPSVKPSPPLELSIDGKAVVSKEDQKSSLSVRWASEGAALDTGRPTSIVITGDERTPVHYSVTVAGVQKLDDARPVGEGVKLTRRYETLDGQPIGDASSVKVGQVIVAKVTLELAKDESYLLVEDRRPAGFEFADDQLRGAASSKAAHNEFRDDRVAAFFASLPAGRHELVYYLRAESAGLSHVLPGVAYPMYRDNDRGETGADRLRIAP